MLAPIWVAALSGTVPTTEARTGKVSDAGDDPTDGHVRWAQNGPDGHLST